MLRQTFLKKLFSNKANRVILTPYSTSCITLSFFRTSNFGAEAKRSYIFLRLKAENVLKMFVN